MDLFNRKALQLANDRAEYLKREHDALKNLIRAMDDCIFAMTQCSDWPSMRLHFNKLQTGMEQRRRIESDRIGNVILTELNK